MLSTILLLRYWKDRHTTIIDIIISLFLSFSARMGETLRCSIRCCNFTS